MSSVVLAWWQGIESNTMVQVLDPLSIKVCEFLVYKKITVAPGGNDLCLELETLSESSIWRNVNETSKLQIVLSENSRIPVQVVHIQAQNESKRMRVQLECEMESNSPPMNVSKETATDQRTPISKSKEIKSESKLIACESKTKKSRKTYTPNNRMREFLKRYKQTAKKKTRTTLKDVKKAHDGNTFTKEEAILSIMMVHYMAGTKAVTFERIFTDLGYRPKNKAMEKAWKKVREERLVEEDKTKKSSKKVYVLTETGLKRVAPKDYQDLEALAKAALPQTNEELHERIKEKAFNKYGVLIFEILLEEKLSASGKPLSGKELAEVCGVDKDSHGFFYGFKWLKDNEYAIPVTDQIRTKTYVLSDEKCFLHTTTPKA